MKVRRQLFASAAVIAAMLALSCGAYLESDRTSFAVRWGLHGEPIAYTRRWIALFLVPAIATALTVFFAVAPQLMPAQSRLERSPQAYTAGWMAALIATFIAQLTVVAANLGAGIDVARLSALIVAVALAVIGNYFGKLRYNYLIGIRTPWTLADERVWDKTHRFAGRLMVASALLMGIAAFTWPAGRDADPWLVGAVITLALAPALAAIVYSILLSRRSETDGMQGHKGDRQ
jgi:uncharacterized membrane protein